jgi:hypothetical protein
MYAKVGRPSIAPEEDLLRAQMPYSIRSERERSCRICALTPRVVGHTKAPLPDRDLEDAVAGILISSLAWKTAPSAMWVGRRAGWATS